MNSKILLTALLSITLVTASFAQEIKATFETTDKENSYQYFGDQKIKRVNSILFDHTRNGDSTHYSHLITGTSSDRIGLSKSLSVKAGDTIQLDVFVKFREPKEDIAKKVADMILTILWANSKGFNFELKGLEQQVHKKSLSDPAIIGDVKSNQEDRNKAYLNWVIFDEHFKLIDGGFARMKGEAGEHGQGVQHELLSSGKLPITKKGFVYTYLSNESQRDVYFDDFSIMQILAVYIDTEGDENILTEDGQTILIE